MTGEYKKTIGLPQSHILNILNSKWGVRKGQDTDTYECEELNEEGTPIAVYTVKDSTSIYPPFGRSITWTQSSVTNN